jgi:hypothetical protein
MENNVDFLRMVLDHQIVDADDVPCGKVDDLIVEGAPGEKLKVIALLVGPGAWADRLPKSMARIAKRIFGGGCVRVSWSEVASINETIKLRSNADKLGLGRVDRRLGKWIARLPRS